MPMTGLALERFVSEHLDTDDWRDGLDDEATITATDLRYPYGVEVLQKVQSLSNSFFPTPKQFSQDDIDALVRAAHLLQGETVTGTWTEGTLTLTPSASGREILEREINESAIILAQEETLIIAGHELSLGSIATHFLSVHVEHWDGIGSDGKGRLTIVPSSTDEFESWRIMGEDTGVDRAVPGVSRQFRKQVTEFMDQNDELLRRLSQ